MDAELSAELAGPDHSNRGLLALCDISCDLERSTSLNELVERRHAATHRFLVAHNLGQGTGRSDWFERVDWSELLEGSVQQLRIARAALVYLARMIDSRESGDDEGHGDGDPDRPVPEVPLLHSVDNRFSEID